MKLNGLRTFVESLLSQKIRGQRASRSQRGKNRVGCGVEACERRLLMTVDVQLLTDAEATPLTWSQFSSATDLSGRTYFTAEDGVHGVELWASDGTLAGTHLLKDINPGNNNANPRLIYAAHGDSLYFVATDYESGEQLWRTDGTEAGTIKLSTSPHIQFSRKSVFVGDTMYVAALDQNSGHPQLWETDGTASGTVLVTDLGAGSGAILAIGGFDGACYFISQAEPMVQKLWKADPVSGQTVFLKDVGENLSLVGTVGILSTETQMFFIGGDGAHGQELWRSDGTGAGTFLVKDVNPGGATGISSLMPFGSAVVFSGISPSNFGELWISDGTDAGTQMVKDIFPSGNLNSLQNLSVIGGKIYFSADDGAHGYEPWVSDGTSAGTLLLADVAAGTVAGGGADFTAFGGEVYFRAGGDLWKTDGTTGGTSLVKDLNGLSKVGPVNGNALTLEVGSILAGNPSEKWVTDGTAAGTQVLNVLVNGLTSGSVTYKYLGAGGGHYFLQETGGDGFEFWMTDLTAAGTFNVGVIEIETDSNLSGESAYSVVGNSFYFAGPNGLWLSHGTSVGTQLLKTFVNAPTSFANLGGVLYFAADDGVHGSELWKSDGTEAGTVLVKEIKSGSTGSGILILTGIGGRLYFFADDGVHGSELWTSDGTAEGTVLLKDMNPGAGRGATSITDATKTIGFVQGGSGIYFAGSDGVHGLELWRTDGTEAGTSMVADLSPGSDQTVIGPAIWWNGAVYFQAITGSDSEPWKFDESTGTASVLADIFPGTSGSNASSFTVFRDKLYFKAVDGTHSSSLWETDGTTAGTVLVMAFGATNSFRGVRGPLVVSGGAMYFTVQTDVGRELWKTDGTTAGTDLFKVLSGYGDITTQTAIMDVQGMLYFWDRRPLDSFSYDLWKSDGTTAGTVLVGDLMARQVPFAVGNGTFSIFGTTMGRDALWFFDDSVHGKEWWSMHSVPEAVGVFRNGKFYLDADGSNRWKVTGDAVTDQSFAFGIAGDTPVAGDWNGDGAKEIGVFRNGTWFFDQNGNHQWNGAAGGDVTFFFGAVGDTPLAGDWNGDGITDVGVNRNGAFYLDLNGNHHWDAAVDAYFKFGNPGDRPVTGDWNGDGKTEIGVMRGPTWYLDVDGNRKWNAGDVSFNFGTTGDVPVTGDWNADGKTDVGVYRNGFYYIDRDGNRKWGVNDVRFGFGIASDVPVVGTWNLDVPAVSSPPPPPAALVVSVPESAAVESVGVQNAVGSSVVRRVRKPAFKKGHHGRS